MTSDVNVELGLNIGASAGKLLNPKNCKALITGVTGFIGASLVVDAKRTFGHVVGTTRRKQGPIESGLSMECLDVACRSDTFEVFRKHKPDVVFHLAGLSNSVQDLGMVRKTFLANALGTVNVLEAAANYGVARFVYCASMNEPGVGDNGDSSSPYAASKFVGSIYSNLFSLLYDLSTVIVRPYYVYGPGNQKPAKLIPHVIRAYLEGAAPRLASGTRQMDWVYIDDVVEGLLRAAVTTEIVGDDIPLGTGILTTISDVVDLVARICKSELAPVYGGEKDRTLEVSPVADVSKCERLLNWSPKTDLQIGLERTVKWMAHHNRK